jgi:phospholipid/cholesterol/gamma-HCH transport system permease protein
MLGAFLLGATKGIGAVEYVTSIQRWLMPRDLYGGVAKTLVFGLIIALVGCRQGLRATGGAAGVGRATISAVVLSIVIIYVANLFLTAGIFRY